MSGYIKLRGKNNYKGVFMKRRDFIKLPCALAAGCLLHKLPLVAEAGRNDSSEGLYIRPAEFYKKLKEKQVECTLCPRHCIVADQETGWCGVRTNQNGQYNTHVFGRPITIHNDPIEKKPFFHVLPGSNSLSFSTAGCNFECVFCQNWEISQFRPEQRPARFGFVSPKNMARIAQRQGSRSVAFTYGEPVVFYEYMYQTAKAAKELGIKGVMVSNGYIEPKPMEKLLDVLGAAKVDFKAFSNDFYKKRCRGTLQPVLDTMKLVRQKNVWLEMVHLTIPTLNDSDDETKRLCDWVLENLGADVPLHFTRFHPTYKLKNLPPTSPDILQRQYKIAKNAGIHFPYVGNMPGHEMENTKCHQCGQLAIRRIGFSVVEMNLDKGKCRKCGQLIPGVWE
jgi:pyruvate formate lyase activating enzyme